jgi:hypothetical protein
MKAWHVARSGRYEMSSGFWLQTLKERDQLVDLCIDGRRILILTLNMKLLLIWDSHGRDREGCCSLTLW